MQKCLSYFFKVFISAIKVKLLFYFALPIIEHDLSIKFITLYFFLVTPFKTI